MKEITLNNKEKINVCTDVDEITITELKLFQQYFGQILWNVDEKNFASVVEKAIDYYDEGKPSKGAFTLHEFVRNLKLQEIGADAWMYCFAILIEKKEPETNPDKLIQLFKEIDVKGLKLQVMEESVANFTKAFPITYNLYQVKKEGLDIYKQML